MLQTLPKISFVTDQWTLLQARLQGAVIKPDHPQYDQARQAWNLSVDQWPAVIVIPKNATDVVEAVRFARREV